MRLHRLAITAFGPFSGTEEIDFDALSDAGLFLIHGQTGAGKTSVLDAVCFALYGQVAGVRNKVKGLRSDHAPADLGPEVVLEATLRGRRFRITRSPEWERPKLRGTGTTRQNAKVTIEEYDRAGWSALSTRLGEADHLIESLLGMSASQFCQVAMLPQGDFAAFLRAGAEERRKVLEKLFATEIFAQVEKWLEDRRAATRREAEALATAAESTAAEIAGATGMSRPDGPHPGLVPAPRTGEQAGTLDLLVPWATELGGHLADIQASAACLLGEAEAVLARVRAASETAHALAARQREHAGARSRLAVLTERAAERRELAARLEAAQRADRVVPLIRAARARLARADEARGVAAGARAAAGTLVPPDAAEDVLAKAERARRDEAAALESLRGDTVRLAEVTTGVVAALRLCTRLRADEERFAAALTELPGRVDGLQAELSEVRLRAAARPGAVTVADDLARRLGEARKRDGYLAALATAQETHRSAVDRAQDRRDELQGLRQARLDGMAAVLAGELVDGEPCLVCGSQVHPAPAGGLGAVPDEADLARAEAAYERAQAHREEALGQVSGLREKLVAAREQVGDRAVPVLAAELAAAEAELNDIDAVAARADGLAAELRTAEDELTRARDGREIAVRELAEAVARHGDLTAEELRLGKRLDEARGDDPTLAARIDRLTGEAVLLQAAAQAARRAEEAAAELSKARGEAGRAAEAEGFGSLEEASAALPAEAERAAMAVRARVLDDEEAAVRERLADPDLAAAAGLPAPDLELLRQELAGAEAAHTAAATATDRAGKRVERLSGLSVELTSRVDAWRPAARRYAVAASLAGLAGGQSARNRLGMRLSAYVLAARLEQVVDAANERLARMSGGRYALLHTVDKAAGDRRGGSGGLGLRMVDGWTGQERDPVTLSGGESFITSLSLALGLSDIVTTENGGAEIGTLFVDEGFGTLDEETLDEVMGVLDGLRDGGRVVGIVSHVTELRTRVPAQLRIHKERDGSRVNVTV